MFTLPELLGHLSFGLTATSWMMKSVLWLRITAIVATGLGIWFNYIIPAGPLWQVIGWLSLFVVINLVQVVLTIRDLSEATLSNREKAILVAAFPQMHTRDFQRLMRAGQLQTLSPGEMVLSIGDKTKAISLVTDGWFDEGRDDGTSYRLGVGSTIGGATFIARDDLGGSPSLVRAGERGVSIVKWPYPLIHRMLQERPRMGGPLYEGMTRSMIVKYRMLREHESAPVSSFRSVDGSLLPATPSEDLKRA